MISYKNFGSKVLANNISFKVVRELHFLFKNNTPVLYGRFKGREYHTLKGVLRWYFQLDKIHKNYCKKPLKKNSIQHLLVLCGIYQILFLNFRNDKVINETIAALKLFKLNQLTNFINAVLRNVCNEKKLDIIFSEKDCFYNQLVFQDWPNNFEYIMFSCLSEPNLVIKSYSGSIKANFLNKTDLDDVYILNEHESVKKLSSLDASAYYVQGLACQYLSYYLPKISGEKIRVLDACCGAGGKLFIVKYKFKDNCIISANDIEESQISRLKENSKRLGLIPDKITNQDFLEYNTKEKYDLIILDVPCSASGNIRNYPELKFRISKNELEKLIKLQYLMLEKAWSVLEDGGSIIYMTCSIFKSENEKQIENFYRNNKNCQIEKDQIPCNGQILPTERTNGFFFKKINKLKNKKPSCG